MEKVIKALNEEIALKKKELEGKTCFNDNKSSSRLNFRVF